MKKLIAKQQVEEVADLADCRMCICLASRRAARAITRSFDRRLRPLGIRSTQFSILTMLILAGPMPIGRLAEWLGVERTTLTRNLDLIEAKGWIKIEAGTDDARSRLVSIAEPGREMAAKALPVWREAQDNARAAVGETGFQSLHALAGTAIA